MDILIKNMKMPKGARKLKIEIDSEGNVDIYSHEINGYYRLERRAIALPPHGELVERSWLRGEIGNAFLDAGGFLNPNSEMYSPLVSKICDAVVNAPTVLEANNE